MSALHPKYSLRWLLLVAVIVVTSVAPVLQLAAQSPQPGAPADTAVVPPDPSIPPPVVEEVTPLPEPDVADLSAEAAAIAAVNADPNLAARHPDAGVWVMYRGQNTVADLQKPYIKGIMAYAQWNKTYTGQNQFNWYSIDSELKFIVNQVGKRAMIDVTAGYCPGLDWPTWMRNLVAAHNTTNSMGCYPLQFWDPVYVDLYKAYIRALATHLAQFDASDARPRETDIVFVRAAVMADTMENLPNDDQMANWEWQDFTPAPNGRIYQVNLTKQLSYAYHQEITLAYQQELARAYAAVGLRPAVAAAKGSTYWGAFPDRDTLVNAGVWFDQHSGGPNPQSWYYDTYLTVRGGATRGASETGGRVPDNLLAQYNYWEVLANLHYGVEFVGLYGTNKFSPSLQPKGAVSYPENQEAVVMADRYAGNYRSPASAPGAWIALRGGYPEERFGGKVYFRRMWTNYEYLMHQYRPQDSVLLYGLAHTDRPIDSITPIVGRKVPQPWTDEVAGCLLSFSAEDCEYLNQQPTVSLGLVSGLYKYTYNRTDLGQVTFCGTNMFCDDPAARTRTETMLWARRTNGQGGSPFMRFDLDDAFAQSLGGRARVRIVYLDQGTGLWELRYDSTSAVEKPALTIQKQNTNTWKEVTVELVDAAFANRQEGATDLSVYNMGDDDDTFHLIEVTRLDGDANADEKLPPATATPVPTATPLPTATPTPAPSPTPTPIPDTIFADSFEANNLWSWTARTTDNGDLVSAPQAALVGAYGMKVVIDDNNSIHLRDDTPNREKRYRARFYLDPNSIRMANGDAHLLFAGYTGTSPLVFDIQFRYSAGRYQVAAGLLDDGNLLRRTAWFAISDAPHFLEVDWKSSSAAGANNGYVSFWVDGILRGEIKGIDNDTRVVDSARLGAITGIDTGTRGTYYLDAFVSKRWSYIGAGSNSVTVQAEAGDASELDQWTEHAASPEELLPPDVPEDVAPHSLFLPRLSRR